MKECKESSKGKIHWRHTTTWSNPIQLWTLFADFFCLEDKTSCTAVWERELLLTIFFLSHLHTSVVQKPSAAALRDPASAWLPQPDSTSYTEESYCTVLKIAPPHTWWGDVLLPVQKHQDSAHRPVSQGKKSPDRGGKQCCYIPIMNSVNDQWQTQ